MFSLWIRPVGFSQSDGRRCGASSRSSLKSRASSLYALVSSVLLCIVLIHFYDLRLCSGSCCRVPLTTGFGCALRSGRARAQCLAEPLSSFERTRSASLHLRLRTRVVCCSVVLPSLITVRDVVVVVSCRRHCSVSARSGIVVCPVHSLFSSVSVEITTSLPSVFD